MAATTIATWSPVPMTVALVSALVSSMVPS